MAVRICPVASVARSERCSPLDDPARSVPAVAPVLVPARGGVPVVLDAVVLAELVSIVLEGAPLGLVLERIARTAVGAIPGALAVSVTVVRERVAAQVLATAAGEGSLRS